MDGELGGAFPKQHRADCGMIAMIRKVAILGRHIKICTERVFKLKGKEGENIESI
jgi:hypothetical protein